MKEVYWTKERLIETASKFSAPVEFKKAFKGAWKPFCKLGLSKIIFPIDQRQRHPQFTFEVVKDLSIKYPQRAKLQLAEPSAYNAAKRNGWLDQLFPPAKNKKYTHQELAMEAAKYDCRSKFESGSPKQYQVAQKRRILDEICPPKMQGVSIAEKELLEFMKTMSPDFKTKRFGNDYEIDCYSESLKMGVEYNGLYWHSEERVGKNYHINKTKYFEKLGIRIIHIWENEWRDRQEQVKTYLMSACGKNSFRVGARKCEFKHVDILEAKKLLNESHIQGAPTDVKRALGCFYNSRLIGVCTFGQHHRQNGAKMMVLNRLAFLPGHTVSGALNKFSKLAFTEFGPLQSWAHIAKSQATGYLRAGWVVKSVSRPDYFYADKYHKIIGKQSRRKKAVGTPDDMTESEHAKKDGLIRIWDCGKVLLIFNPL